MFFVYLLRTWYTLSASAVHTKAVVVASDRTV